MRTLNDPDGHTQIYVVDESERGACHEYQIEYGPKAGKPVDCNDYLAIIRFQKGPIKDEGVNGCTNEDLLKIVIDQLEQFQAAELSCTENAYALGKCQEALMWLQSRTADRKKRGVEGKYEI